MGLPTFGKESHYFLTRSENPSCRNQDSSKEKCALFPMWACLPESISNSVWSEPARASALTVTRGNLFSHSALARILSNFSYVGVARRLAHVYFLPDKAISRRSRLSVIALNLKDHLELKLSLFFSSLRQMVLKSHPMSSGNDSLSKVWRNSERNSSFFVILSRPINRNQNQVKTITLWPNVKLDTKVSIWHFYLLLRLRYYSRLKCCPTSLVAEGSTKYNLALRINDSRKVLKI
jgi:hypothetical protein